MANYRTIVAQRLVGALAAFSVAFAGLVLVAASPAGASSNTPDPSGYWGACNIVVKGDSFSGPHLPTKFDVACSYALPTSTPSGKGGVGSSGLASQSGHRFDFVQMSVGGVDHPITGSNNGTFMSGSIISDTGTSTEFLEEALTGDSCCYTAVDATAALSTERLVWTADSSGIPVASGDTPTSTSSYWMHVESVQFVAYASSITPAVPTNWTSSGGITPPPVPCTVTWDTPSTGLGGPFLFAGTTITFSIHLVDLTRYVAVDVGARRISDEFGTATPAAPTPPTPDTNLYAAHSTALAHDMTMQVTPTQDGHYQYQYRCQTVAGGLSNEIGGTLTGTVVWPADVTISVCVPVIGIETCGVRPGLEDCIPTSSGGLFGIIGTVLDPNTYVRATVCMAEALFMPGPTTTAALQSLWTLAQSRAPFSYMHDAIVFLPSAISSFSSGLSGGSGSCLINIPGAGCASIGTSSDLSLVRSVLLFLFVGLLTLAVIRTTMRVANGG